MPSVLRAQSNLPAHSMPTATSAASTPRSSVVSSPRSSMSRGTSVSSKFANNMSAGKAGKIDHANGAKVRLAAASSSTEPAVFRHESYERKSLRDDKLRTDQNKVARHKEAKALQKKKVLSHINKFRRQGVGCRSTPKSPFVPNSISGDLDTISMDAMNKLLRIKLLKRQANKERRNALKQESRQQTRTQGDADFFLNKSSVKKMKRGQGSLPLDERAMIKEERRQKSLASRTNFSSSGTSGRKPVGYFRDVRLSELYKKACLGLVAVADEKQAGDMKEHDSESRQLLTQLYGQVGAARAHEKLVELGLRGSYESRENAAYHPEMNTQVAAAAAAAAACQVCFCLFDETCEPVQMSNCKHAMICPHCFTEYVRIRIRDQEVVPWLPCPEEKCRVPVHAKDLIALDNITASEFYRLCKTSLQKTIAGSENWVECKNEKCDFGFVVCPGDNSARKCGVCGQAQQIECKAPPVDTGFADLINNGTMRDCPKCHFYTIKEYGMCNLIQCDKCGIWWNWRNKETAATCAELKEKARTSGTMWEAGELDYQLRLERENPSAFRALLERNGIKYNPNYVRGRS